MATQRGLTVSVKARFSYEVVSFAFGIFPLYFQNGSCKFQCKRWLRASRPAFSCKFQCKMSLSHGLWNILVILGLSDRSRCRAVLILRWLAQPSLYFGPVTLLSLWRGAHLDGQGILRRDLDKEVSYTEFAQRSCTESYFRDIVQRSCQDTFYIVLWRSCTETLHRALLQRSLPRNLLHKFCRKTLIESLYRDLIKRFCKEIFDLARRALIDILYRDLVQRAQMSSSEILHR